MGVYLAIERAAALEAVKLAQKESSAVWVGVDAFSEEEIKGFRLDGVNLTTFVFPLSKRPTEELSSVLDTIREHHPGETIWVQHVPHDGVET